MPLYDCMLLLKPQVERAAIVDLLSRLGRRVYSLNGVVTDIKSFGKVYLGYGIKKLDGRYYQVPSVPVIHRVALNQCNDLVGASRL